MTDARFETTMNQILTTWAAHWQIPPAALIDLRNRLIADIPTPTDPAVTSEAAVQSAVRLEASRRGCLLFRNNVGAGDVRTYDKNGKIISETFMRWGLANDSKQLNARLKSADLIGIRPVVITPCMVGRTVGVFLSREVKAAGWKYRGTEREQAQLRWAELIISMGGDAAFAVGEGTI